MRTKLRKYDSAFLAIKLSLIRCPTLVPFRMDLRVNNIKRTTFARTLKWIRRANDGLFCCIFTVTALLGCVA